MRGSSHVPAPVSGTRPRCTKFQANRAFGRGEADVALRGEFGAHADGGAVDRTDRRLRALRRSATSVRPPRPPPRRPRDSPGTVARSARSVPAQNAPGTPVITIATVALVGVGAADGLDELAEHRVRHRVALLGPVDRDDPDLALDVVADQFPCVLSHPIDRNRGGRAADRGTVPNGAAPCRTRQLSGHVELRHEFLRAASSGRPRRADLRRRSRRPGRLGGRAPARARGLHEHPHRDAPAARPARSGRGVALVQGQPAASTCSSSPARSAGSWPTAPGRPSSSTTT